MAVVAHHPVVVHLERIAGGFLAVDEDFAILHLQVVALIYADRTVVDGNVLERELHRGAFLWNPDRTIVVARPSRMGIQRIHLAGERVRVQADACHQVLAGRKGFHGSLRQRHIAVLVQTHQVFHRDAQFLEQFVGQLALQFHVIGVLHVFWFLVGLSVEVDDAVLNLQRLSGKSHAALHVVLAAVGRPGVNCTIFRLVLADVLSAHVIDGLIVVPLLLCIQRVQVGFVRHQLVAERIAHQIVVGCLILRVGADGVAGRIVEHHDVVQFHLAKAFHAAIVPLRPLDIRLAVEQRQRVLCQRHGQRSLRYSRSVAHLRHEQVVAREQRFLQR